MNGLQLLDLGYEVEYIEIDTSKVPYNFAVKLGDRTFTFCIRWNDVGGLFNVVEDERFPAPVIIPRCLTGDAISEITFQNFGKQVKLYVYKRVTA